MAETMKIHADEIEGLDERLKQFEKIDKRLEKMVIKEEFNAESKIIQQQFESLMIRIEEQEKRFSFLQVTCAFFSVISVTMIAILVLLMVML